MDSNTQRKCSKNLQEILCLSDRLLALADQGDAIREDVGCGVLYGLVRDSAYKLRSHTQTEIDQHKRSGKWCG